MEGTGGANGRRRWVKRVEEGINTRARIRPKKEQRGTKRVSTKEGKRDEEGPSARRVGVGRGGPPVWNGVTEDDAKRYEVVVGTQGTQEGQAGDSGTSAEREAYRRSQSPLLTVDVETSS